MRYRLCYDIGPDPSSGRRRQRTETIVGSKRDAERVLAARLVAAERGEVAASRGVTLGAWLREWLAAYAPTKRGSTVAGRRDDAERHLIPNLGAVRLDRLRRAQIAALYAELGATLSPGTIRHVHSTLTLALAAAVRDGLLARNPAQGVPLPRQPEGEVAFWMPATVRAFLASTATDALHVAWVLLVYSHVRTGELVALQWRDVDWERSLIRIQRTAARSDGPGEEINPPKTRSGRRAILLPAEVMTALRAHRAAQDERRRVLGDKWIDGEWVIEAGDGRRLSRNGVRDRFRAAVARSGLPPITPKGLRHSGATMLLAGGIHPEIARERLGHADISVTIGTYSHALVEMQEAAVAQLERMVRPPASTDGADGRIGD